MRDHSSRQSPATFEIACEPNDPHGKRGGFPPTTSGCAVEDHPHDIDGIGCGLYSLARHARHLDGLRNQTHMNPRVTDVKPQPEYKLKLTFTNGEVRVFDMKPYLDTGIFQQLREEKLFNSVRPVLGSIQCENEADLCPDTLYEKSRPVASAKPQRFQVAESRTRYGRKRR